MRQRPRLAAHAARGTAALRLMTHPDPRPRARSALEDAAAVPPRLKLEEMQLEKSRISEVLISRPQSSTHISQAVERDRRQMALQSGGQRRPVSVLAHQLADTHNARGRLPPAR